jgi:nucleoside phosphorylase
MSKPLIIYFNDEKMVKSADDQSKFLKKMKQLAKGNSLPVSSIEDFGTLINNLPENREVFVFIHIMGDALGERVDEDLHGVTWAISLKQDYPNCNYYFVTSNPMKTSVEIYDKKTAHNINTLMDKIFVESSTDFLSQKIKEVKSLDPPVILTSSTSQNANSGKEKCNVVVVCVTPSEFEAMDLMFKLNENEPYKIIEGNRFWKSSITQNINSHSNLSLILAMIGDEGNIPTSTLISSIFEHFQFDLICIAGIAAGNIDKINVYSTVIGNYIVYYENQKLIVDASEPRNKPIPIDNNRGKDLPYITGNHHAVNWKTAFENKLKALNIEISEFDKIQGEWLKPDWFEKVKVSSGTILSGEKLFADGTTLLELFKNNTTGKDALAGEMEGYGFAHTCFTKRHNDWLVIRGISDYGGVEKLDPINKQYQKVAALSAMTLLEYYLQNVYSPVNKS